VLCSLRIGLLQSAYESETRSFSVTSVNGQDWTVQNGAQLMVSRLLLARWGFLEIVREGESEAGTV